MASKISFEQFKEEYRQKNGIEVFDSKTSFQIKPSTKLAVTVKYFNGTSKEYASLQDLQSTGAEFEQLIADVEAKNRVFSIGYWVTAFSDQQNLNFSRPKPGKLKSIAKKYTKETAPLQDDHYGAQSSRKGRVDVLEYVEGSPSTLDALVSVRKPDAQADYLRGLSPDYSASFDHTKAECSICNKQYKSERWGSFVYTYPSCEHRRGQNYDGKACEMFFWGSRFTELSRTGNPADLTAKPKSKSFSEDNDDTQTENEMADKAQLEAQLAEKDTEIAKLKADFKKSEDARAVAEIELGKVLESERKFAVQLLQNDGRLTKADADNPEIKKIFQDNGTQSAFAIISRFEKKIGLGGTLDAKPPSDPPAPSTKTEQELQSFSDLRTAWYMHKKYPEKYSKPDKELPAS